MTRSGVGRSLRAASRQAYAPPTTKRSPSAPGSQPAAGKGVVRVNRSVLRAGLRTLVVAGFAGAAWLLSANAARAADAPATDRTTGLSVMDLVLVPGTGEAQRNRVASPTLVWPLTNAATTAHQPAPGTAAAALTDVDALASTAISVASPDGTADRASPIVDPATITDPALPAGVAWPVGATCRISPNSGTGGAMASRCLPVVTELAVPRLDTEAPTVSPD